MKSITRADMMRDPEYIADCMQARRAIADAVADRRRAEREKVERWLGREVPVDPIKAKAISCNARRHCHDGKNLTVKQWANLTGVAPATIHYRLRTGMPIAQA